MVAIQFQFMPLMLQGPEYNCSSIMPPGPEWAARYGVKQFQFGTYSVVFGVITEVKFSSNVEYKLVISILYIPCTMGLRRDLKASCFKIMFWLSIMDMVAIMANCVLFGILLIKGDVYCSNPAMTLGVGIVGYCIWLTASSSCLVLGVNRLFEMLKLSRYFSRTRTNIYIGCCVAYGLLLTLFTRPVIVNSTLQSMFFSPFIPGHDMDEYVNWAHAVHNICIACFTCLLYLALTVVIMMKSRSVSDANKSRVNSNSNAVFIQVMIICGANLVATTIYVYMNFLPSPPVLIVVGQVGWQLIHGVPPFIYLALNKSIRNYALKAVQLDFLFDNRTTATISITYGTNPPRG